MTRNVPARIETERLVVRVYSAEDADALDAVIPANREHLRRFLPWAEREPLSPTDRAALIARFVQEFDAQEDFTMGVFDRADGTYLGGTGLHTRIGPDALEIGYWIRADREGSGLVTEAVAALVQVTLGHLGARWAEVRCEPANLRSRAVPERLGFTLSDTRVDACGTDRTELIEIWQLRAEDLAGSAAARAPRPTMRDREGIEIPWR